MLSRAAAVMSVSAFTKGVEKGLEAGFGTLLGSFEPGQFRHADAHQLFKTTHALLEALVVPRHARFEAIHTGFGTIHAGFGTIHAGFGTIHVGFGTIHAGVSTIHAGVSTIHAGFGGRLAFCHLLQNGFDFVKLLSNVFFHTQIDFSAGKSRCQVLGSSCQERRRGADSSHLALKS